LGAHSRIPRCRWRAATALALLALLLIPINYRAGASVPHGHALIQLVFETRWGIPVHRHGIDRIHEGHAGGDIASSGSGAPAVQIIAGSALLPLLLAALSLRPPRASIRLVSEARPASRSVIPGHPPPQASAFPTSSP
jgi:hypothetical protein